MLFSASARDRALCHARLALLPALLGVGLALLAALFHPRP
jgi:hypothetical protein